MKTITAILIILIFSINTIPRLYATNPISPEGLEKIQELKTIEKAGVLKKIKTFKNFFNLNDEQKKARPIGVLSLVFGIAAVVTLYLITVTSGGWALGTSAILALLGGITGISALWKTRKNKKEHRSTRSMAWVGLALSLLTGILPIILVIILALAFR